MKARHTLPVVLLCILALVMATAASCGGDSVAADQAQMDMTFTGEGTSYVGDREIIEGPATVTFSNETSDEKLIVISWIFETGSDELAQELEVLPEGSFAERSATEGPAGGWGDEPFIVADTAQPGTNSYTVQLVPGTYLFDAVPGGNPETGVWRVAVIEVVAE